MTPSAAIEHVLSEVQIQPPVTVEDCAALRDLIRELIGPGPALEIYVRPAQLILQALDRDTSARLARRVVNLETGEVSI